MQIAAGLVLAAACGLRAFLPLSLVSLAAYFNYLPLHPKVAWLGSLPAVVVFGAAVVFEVLGDKFPVVDHFLDVLGTFVRPAAGALVAFGMLPDLDPTYALAVALVAGAPLALGVHLVKAKSRLAVNLLTLGVAGPVLSLLEDLLALLAAVLALLLPIAALGLAVGVAVLLAAKFGRPRRAVPAP